MLSKIDLWMWQLISTTPDLTPQSQKSYGSPMQKSSSNTRKQLLDAAETVVRRDGVAKLTLDAVAKEAGVSKGGILYHFSGKELLIQGMLERLSHSFETEMETLYAQEPEGPGRWLRVYIRTLRYQEPEHDLTSALIAALATNMDLLDPFEKTFAEWQKRGLNDGIDPGLALVIMNAVDGYWFSSIFTQEPLISAAQYQLFLDQLLVLAGGQALA